MASESSTPSPSAVLPSDSPNAPISPLSLPPGDTSPFAPPRLDPIIEHVKADYGVPKTLPARPRISSMSSISFKGNGVHTLAGQPTGRPKARSIRSTSPPPPARFQHHVSFDNFTGGEPTEKNTISFTLNVKHKGYQFKRRSRTFMVGIDENDYSDIALQWMLEELVDDGDEIICLRVVDKDTKLVSDRNLEKRQYQKEARDMLERIQQRNDEHRAISIVLEFAVGKLHATFQKMIQIYEPAMLIVGTRGRSLGGFQGLVSNRNSFSKWCLQYSPVPVVVVRPTEKRMKKKKKRDADPTRQDYARILKDSGIQEHETTIGTKNSIFEQSNDPDSEAHAVAAALGLPARFDPTLRHHHPEGSHALKKIDSGKSDATNATKSSLSPESRPSSPSMVMKSPKGQLLEDPLGSGDESSGEEDSEGEFEVISGHALLGDDGAEVTPEIEEIEKKKKLHDMEVGEAAALAAGRKNSVASADSLGSGTGSGSGTTIAEEEEEEIDDVTEGR